MYEQQQYHHQLEEDISAGDLTYDYASQLMFDSNAFPVAGTELDFDATQYIDPSQYVDLFHHQQQEQQQQQQQQHQKYQQSSQPSQNNSFEDMIYSAQDYTSSSSTSSIGTAPNSLPNQSLIKTLTDTANSTSFTDPVAMGHTTSVYSNPPPSTYGMLEYDMDPSGAYQNQYLSYPMSFQDYGQQVPMSPSAYATHHDTKPQIYVRKACVSCKQSHVACDIQRPCNRCVRLNKGDTCVDAERKKRGRPCGSSKKKKEAVALNHPSLA